MGCTADGGGGPWHPIDTLLAAACRDLGVGQMVQCDTFSLFEAMSAVEVGHAKMDPTAQPVILAEDLLRQGLGPTSLTPEQQLAVMDRLLHLEASHYCNSVPLAASVYTSLYMMDPERLAIPCPLLHAFCVSLAQTCDAVRWLVFHGAVSEEEDFNLMIAGLPCEDGASSGGAVPISTSCLGTVEAAIQLAQQQADEQPQLATTYALMADRLRWRKELHQALAHLQSKTPAEQLVCRSHLAAALEALAACSSHPTSPQALAAAPGFAQGLNRHLMGPAPPRIVQLLEPEAAVTALKVMLEQVEAATHVADCARFREVIVFIEHFASLRAGVVARSAAHYLVSGKAWAAAAALPDGSVSGAADGQGDTSCPWALDRPLLCEALALPVAPPICEEVQVFLEQAAIAVGNWAQAMLLSPGRQRRRLRRTLDDWANLYQHALNADLAPDFGAWMARTGWVWVPGQAGAANPITGELDLQGPLATWVEAGIAACQAAHLALGWELELYSPPEYCALYWYSSNLLNTRRHGLQLLASTKAPAEARSPTLPARGRAKAKQPAMSAATLRRLAGLNADIIHTELVAGMCSAMVRLVLGLERAGMVSAPVLPFNTPRERFDQRFACFHAENLVRPEPFNYDQFVEATTAPNTSALDLLSLAAESLTTVRRAYAAVKAQLASPAPPAYMASLSAQQLAELSNMDKVAAINTLAINLVIRAHSQLTDNGDTRPMSVAFDFAHHQAFPSLKIKSSSSGQKGPSVGS